MRLVPLRNTSTRPPDGDRTPSCPRVLWLFASSVQNKRGQISFSYRPILFMYPDNTQGREYTLHPQQARPHKNQKAFLIVCCAILLIFLARSIRSPIQEF